MACEAVTAQMNQVSGGSRDAKQVKKKFGEFKTAVRKKRSEEVKYRNGTGTSKIY